MKVIIWVISVSSRRARPKSLSLNIAFQYSSTVSGTWLILNKCCWMNAVERRWDRSQITEGLENRLSKLFGLRTVGRGESRNPLEETRNMIRGTSERDSFPKPPGHLPCFFSKSVSLWWIFSPTSLCLAQFHAQRKYSGNVCSINEWINEQRHSNNKKNGPIHGECSVQHGLEISWCEVWNLSYIIHYPWERCMIF